MIEVARKAMAKAQVSFPSAVAACRPVIYATAAAHAQATPLGTLEQHHADQTDGEDQVDDENDVFHRRGPFARPGSDLRLLMRCGMPPQDQLAQP